MSILETENTPVVRTDFSDDTAWESICSAIQKPVGEFRAHVDLISDPAYKYIPAETLVALVPASSNHTFIFVVDQVTLSTPELPILVIDLFWERGRTFRVIPSEMWGVENNLSLGNMDFEEFADAVDSDGIFRGFPQV